MTSSVHLHVWLDSSIPPWLWIVLLSPSGLALIVLWCGRGIVVIVGSWKVGVGGARVTRVMGAGLHLVRRVGMVWGVVVWVLLLQRTHALVCRVVAAHVHLVT